MTKGSNVEWGETVSDVTEVFYVHHNDETGGYCVDINVVKVKAGCGMINLGITDANGNPKEKPDYVCGLEWAAEPDIKTKVFTQDEIDSGEPRITYFIAKAYGSSIQNCSRRFKLIETYEFDCKYAECSHIDASYTINSQLEKLGGYYVIKRSEWGSGEISDFITFRDQKCVETEVKPEDSTHIHTGSTTEEGFVKYSLSWNWDELDKEHYIIDYWVRLNKTSTSTIVCVDGTGEDKGIKLTFDKNN
jgi:hypothetical protein